MECRLTRICAISLLVVGRASAEPAHVPSAQEASARESVTTAVTSLSVHWESLPLGDAVARLREASKIEVFVDRRVDPTQRVYLSIENATADEILEKLAAIRSLGVSRLDSLLYLGPSRAATELQALAALRREDIAKLRPQEQRSWSKKTSVAWPRLTEPRDLITQFLQDRGLQVVGVEHIPYDLWPAGHLPKLTMADGLTVLLIGFDLTYRPVPGKAAIAIVPIGETVTPSPQFATASRPDYASSTEVKGNTKKVYTLRVQQQPIGKVLDQIGGQLHLDLTLDEAAIQAAGLSLDQRVSFEVRDADLDGLLGAALRSAGMTFKRDRERITIIPR